MKIREKSTLTLQTAIPANFRRGSSFPPRHNYTVVFGDAAHKFIIIRFRKYTKVLSGRLNEARRCRMSRVIRFESVMMKGKLWVMMIVWCFHWNYLEETFMLNLHITTFIDDFSSFYQNKNFIYIQIQLVPTCLFHFPTDFQKNNSRFIFSRFSFLRSLKLNKLNFQVKFKVILKLYELIHKLQSADFIS